MRDEVRKKWWCGWEVCGKEAEERNNHNPE